ncbi:MAG TPA: arylsulfatase [Opitutaceae bacterium]|nr:arylsulfatase [Opitutaceae bacterium]
MLFSTSTFLRLSGSRAWLGKTFGVLLASLLTGLSSLLAQAPSKIAAASRNPPNIIFILADDLGYGDLGCYGQTRIQTPNLDRLAAQGIRFTQFYAGAPVCAPSRSVLMTGQHTGHTTVRGNAKVNLHADEVTIARVLKSAGYATGLVGKWGLGAEKSVGAPTRQGFDFFYGYVDQTMAHNYYPAFLVRNEERVLLRNVVPNPGPYGQGVATVKVDYSADLIANEAENFVRDHRSEPFFLYFAATLPHANGEEKPDGMEVPDYGPYAKEKWPTPSKGYAAMVTLLDSQVGRLVNEIETLGLADNTIILFASDNGPHREGGNVPEFFNSSGPLRGVKRDVYEGGIRVPLIVRWPGHAPAGRTSDHIGYFGDFMATFAELAGRPTPPGTDSISLVPTLTGHESAQKKHDYLYWEFYEGASAQAVRRGHWKAVRSPMLTGKIELYDLSKDLGEQHDIAAQHPEIVARLRADMEEAHVPSPLFKPGAPVNP